MKKSVLFFGIFSVLFLKNFLLFAPAEMQVELKKPEEYKAPKAVDEAKKQLDEAKKQAEETKEQVEKAIKDNQEKASIFDQANDKFLATDPSSPEYDEAFNAAEKASNEWNSASQALKNSKDTLAAWSDRINQLSKDLEALTEKLGSIVEIKESTVKEELAPEAAAKEEPTVKEEPAKPLVKTEDIGEKTTSEVYKVITGLQVRTFGSGSYLDKGLSEFDLWNSLLKAVGGYLDNPQGLEEIYKKNLPKYKNDFNNLKKVNAWLDSTIKEIQEKGLSDQFNQVVQKQIQTNLNDTNEIIQFSFKNVAQDPARGELISTWESKLKGQSIKDIFPKVDDFLKQYTSAKSNEERTNIISTYVKGKFAVSDVLEKLTKIIYLEDKKSFLTRNKKRLNQSKAVLKDISNQYPDETYPYKMSKFSDSNDKPSVIIIGVADSLRGALEHFQKNLKQKSSEIPEG